MDVEILELVEPSQHTCASNSSQDVGSCTFHQGHKALVLRDLDETIHGSLVLDSTSRGHHHAPSDGVNGVGHETGSYGDSPSQQEGNSNASIRTQEERLECVVEAEVHATIDEDTDSRDSEPSVQSLDTIGLQCFDVNINETVELTLTTLTLGVVSEPEQGIVLKM